MIIANRQVFWIRLIRRKTLYVLVLVLVGMLSAAGDTSFDRDEALSRAYVKVALDLNTDPHAEASLLDAALEFDPNNSDARYLRAERMLEDGSSIQKAVGELEKALESNSWFYSDSVSAVLLLAEQYDRLMHYDSMWSALNTLNDSQRVDGRWYYYALRAAVFTNRLEDARLIARKGTQLFPQHEEIKALRVELDPVYREALSDKLSVPDGPAVSEILLRRLILATSPDKRPPLIQRYIDMGYDDPRIHLLRDFISENPDGLDITFMLKEQYLQSLFSFRQVYLLFEQEERVDEFREFCEDRRIKIREDRNSDGYEDAVYILEDARLVEVGKDLDQDSIQEIVIRFNTGSEAPFVPKNLSLRYDEKYYFFTYGRYPEILSVKIDGPDSVQEFSFAESVFTMDAVEYEHLPPFAELDYGGIPGDRELEDRAFRYVSYDASGTVRRDTSGAKIREENGQTVKILSHGEETWIERDLDGDGQSEIREIYRDNSLYGVYLDQDGNGISEYFYYPSQSLQAWDWDQDGKLDYQSYNGN